MRRHLDVLCASAFLVAAAATAGASRPCSVGAAPQCAEVDAAATAQLQHVHGYLAAALAALLHKEVMAAAVAALEARDARALEVPAPVLAAPALTMCAVLVPALVAQLLLASGCTLAIAAHPARGSDADWRPVPVVYFAEWAATVPFLLLLVGREALKLELRQVRRPLPGFAGCIALALIAQTCSDASLRWVLIAAAAACGLLAGLGIARWTRRDHHQDPAASRRRGPAAFGLLAITAAAFGLVYLLATVGVVDAEAERLLYGVFGLASKLLISWLLAFVQLAERRHAWKVVAAKQIAKDVALTTALRNGFDQLLPCSVDVEGACLLPVHEACDMSILEALVGRPVSGVSFQELIANSQDSEIFEEYAIAELQRVLKVAASPPDDLPTLVLDLHSPGGLVKVALYLCADPPKMLLPDQRPDLLVALRTYWLPSGSSRHDQEPQSSRQSYWSGSYCSGSRHQLDAGPMHGWPEGTHRVATSETSLSFVSSRPNQEAEELESPRLPPIFCPPVSLPIANDGGLSPSGSFDKKQVIAPILREAESQTEPQPALQAASQTEPLPALQDTSCETPFEWIMAPLKCTKCARPPSIRWSTGTGKACLTRGSRSCDSLGSRHTTRSTDSACSRHTMAERNSFNSSNAACSSDAKQKPNFDGHWLLVEKQGDESAWLEELCIHGEVVIDGLGTQTALRHHENGTGLEGGMLSLRAGYMYRAGKSGRVLKFARAGSEATRSTSFADETTAGADFGVLSGTQESVCGSEQDEI